MEIIDRRRKLTERQQAMDEYKSRRLHELDKLRDGARRCATSAHAESEECEGSTADDLLRARCGNMSKDWLALAASWVVVEEHWKREIKRLNAGFSLSVEASVGLPLKLSSWLPSMKVMDVKNVYRLLPLTVVAGMLLVWIAQWLFWSGFVGLAGDR